jgi:hypothetical protein
MGRSPQQGRFGFRTRGPRSRRLAVGIGSAALAVAAAGCTNGSSATGGTTPVTGGTAVFALPPATTPCDWDLANWGGGWSFSPDYEPTGEQLFLSGAVANSGGYADPHDDALINATLTNSDVQAMYDWQEYLSSQLPMLWQPNADYQLNEIADNLRGVTPMSPTLSINPENWYFVR